MILYVATSNFDNYKHHMISHDQNRRLCSYCLMIQSICFAIATDAMKIAIAYNYLLIIPQYKIGYVARVT